MVEAFKDAGFNQEQAAQGAQLMESGRFFGFADAADSLRRKGFSLLGEDNRPIAPDVSESSIVRVARRLGGGGSGVIEESRTALQVRPLVMERASAQPVGEGRLKVCLIDAGQGSSGYYPAETLRAAAPLFKAGTHCYVDHPTQSESFERPERTVRDLAGVLATNASFRDGGLYADIKVFSSHRALITEAAPHIGMSIRAEADVSERAVAGQVRRVVEAITRVQSIDFVTASGRGGRILSVN